MYVEESVVKISGSFSRNAGILNGSGFRNVHVCLYVCVCLDISFLLLLLFSSIVCRIRSNVGFNNNHLMSLMKFHTNKSYFYCSINLFPTVKDGPPSMQHLAQCFLIDIDWNIDTISVERRVNKKAANSTSFSAMTTMDQNWTTSAT